jgi:hypothetical protein
MAMSRVIVRVDRSAAGQTVQLPGPHEFWLGPTAYGYGISWHRPAARAEYEYSVEWPAPYDPVRFEWAGNEYVFALEGVGEETIVQARSVQVKEGMGFA